MAEQERVDVNMGQNTDRRTTNVPPDYLNYQASQQYWQYYYSYYMYYYTSYYYMALSQQNSGGVFAPSFAANIPAATAVNSARNLPQNAPDLRQRLVNGGLVGFFDLRQRTEPVQRYEYKVASLWKRVFAEFIDFVFLYFLKYSLFLLYYKDPDKLNSQFQYILVIDDNTSMKDIEDVLIQALIYRLIVFFYEAFFLAVSFPCKTGGATLGKYMMGITVVWYPSMTPIEGHNLRRFSGIARRLPLWQSCVRATLKNFMITFFFPIIFTTMFLQNYRTPYDFLASSVVVDADPRQLTHQN